MSYFKCVTCRIRLDQAGPEADLFEGLCPICGTALEPAATLAELVGFRSFDLAGDEQAFDNPADARKRSVRRVQDLMARRDTAHTQTRLDAERWIDDYRSDVDAVRIGLVPEALRRETELRIGAWNELGRSLSERFLAAAATRA